MINETSTPVGVLVLLLRQSPGKDYKFLLISAGIFVKVKIAYFLISFGPSNPNETQKG